MLTIQLFQIEGKCNFCSVETVCWDNEKQLFMLLFLLALHLCHGCVDFDLSVVWRVVVCCCGTENLSVVDLNIIFINELSVMSVTKS